jgi:hypothetical protein
MSKKKITNEDKKEINEVITEMGFVVGKMNGEDIELFLDAMMPTKFTEYEDAFDYVHSINS